MVGPKEMQARGRAIGRTGRQAVLLAVLVLGACGGSSSEDEASGPATDATEVTTTSEAPSGADAPAGALDCDGDLAASVLGPPTVDSVGWQEQRPVPEQLEELGALLPEDLVEPWEQDVIGAVTAGGPTTYEDYIGFVDTVDLVARWVRSQCPAAPPSWTCVTDDGPEADVPPADAEQDLPASPEDVVAGLEEGDAALELDRSDTAVLYGWSDETGALERTVRVAQVADGGWKAATPTTCLDEEDREELRELMGVVGELDEG